MNSESKQSPPTGSTASACGWQRDALVSATALSAQGVPQGGSDCSEILKQLSCPPDCVLFDLDGTLMDTAADFIAALNALAAEKHTTPPSEKAVRQTVSDGGRALVKLMFGITEEEPAFPALLQRLLDLYAVEVERSRAKLYPGMARLLTELDERGIPWGIVTNKPGVYASPLLSRFGLLDRCQALVCPEHVQKRKPDAEPILLACKLLQQQPQRTVYLGDHERDMQAARNAGAVAVAATYGYLSEAARPEKWPADFLLTDPQRVIPLLNRIGRGMA